MFRLRKKIMVYRINLQWYTNLKCSVAKHVMSTQHVVARKPLSHMSDFGTNVMEQFHVLRDFHEKLPLATQMTPILRKGAKHDNFILQSNEFLCISMGVYSMRMELLNFHITVGFYCIQDTNEDTQLRLV